MNIGQFNAQKNEIGKLLTSLCLLEEKVEFPKYEAYSASNFRNKTYIEIWKFAYDLRIYDFKLVDGSLLQLTVKSFDPLLVNYSFLECPYEKIFSIEEFSVQIQTTDSSTDDFELLRAYDYYLESLGMKESVAPIRYDYDPDSYMEGRHPASHLHIGRKNDIRIGSKKILNPLSFTCFIIRQMYPEEWCRLLSFPNASIILRNIRDNLEDIRRIHWNSNDNNEMFLN